MPIYHFNFYDGIDAVDKSGTEFPDQRTAQNKALKFAATLLLEQPDKFWESRDWRIEVTDSTGLKLFVVHLLGTISPAGRAQNNPEREGD